MLISGGFWICLIVGIGFGIWSYTEDKKIGESLVCAFFSTLLTALVCSFITLMAMDFSKDERVTLSETTTIRSLKEGNSGLQGNFFLGSGSIGTEWYYVAFVETPDGIHKEKYDQEITYIKEVDGVTPKAEKYVEGVHHNKMFRFMVGDNGYREGIEAVKYILYVPKGTIIKEFHLE